MLRIGRFCNLLLALSFLSVGNAQGLRKHNAYYARFDKLATAFPTAFRAFIRPEFIYPTYAAKWTGRDPKPSKFVIEGRLTSLGQTNASVNGNSVAIRGEVNWESSRLVLLENVSLSVQLPRGYAWRVLLAELLLKYPEIQEIRLSSSVVEDGIDVAQCAEYLSRGTPLEHAIHQIDVAHAFKAFGFGVERSRISGFNNANDYNPGEFGLNLNFRRVP